VRVHPFRALRPTPEEAPLVASPPYDVLSRDEAVRLARDNPRSFLHVVRSEVDLAPDVDPHDPRVYDKARENLAELVRRGTLRRESRPSLYLYRLVREDRAQVGVVGCVHVDDYERGLIKTHEATRPDKEDDRTRHIQAVGAHAEPVLLAYRGRVEIDRLSAAVTAAAPLYDFTAPDGVRHSVWEAADPTVLVAAFGPVPCAYVADGHHRSASAWRVARERRAAASLPAGGGAEHDWFLAALFPAAELRILPYNRLVLDLGGRTAEAVLAALRAIGRLSLARSPSPARPGSFCFYLDRAWHLLELDEASIDRTDVLRSLDVALLEERVLGPVLGIRDQRTDRRVDFVGGVRGTAALETAVDAGAAAMAVSMAPTTVEQLMAVSDAGRMMPPKSTWFEPKLASGLFVHSL
jgi:uncharacterized protein (DUF1015 family)